MDRPTPEEAAARKAALIVALKREADSTHKLPRGVVLFLAVKARCVKCKRIEARIAALEVES